MPPSPPAPRALEIAPRSLLVLALSALAAGCYRYVPAPPSATPPGTEIRATLTDAGQQEVRSYFGDYREAVDGPVVRREGNGVSLLVVSEIYREGFPPTEFADTLRLLPQHIQTVRVKELDGWRTAGAAALIVGGAVAAVLVPRALGGTSESGDGEGGGEGDPIDPDEQILIRIPFNFSFW